MKLVRAQQDLKHPGTWLVEVLVKDRWVQMSWWNTPEEAMAEKERMEQFCQANDLGSDMDDLLL
ncbi:MAG: hypothetical protein IKX02_03355 [Spirochaetales bacterium]|nr:hypothetical protein [Spirochaetales bacterium]